MEALVINGVEQMYIDSEIHAEVEKNVDKILEYLKDEERSYADGGLVNQYETSKVYYDIDSKELYSEAVGRGLVQDVLVGIKRGSVVEVGTIYAGYLMDSAKEGIDCWWAEEGSEEYEKAIEDYIENYINECTDICVVTNAERNAEYIAEHDEHDEYNEYDED